MSARGEIGSLVAVSPTAGGFTQGFFGHCEFGGRRVGWRGSLRPGPLTEGGRGACAGRPACGLTLAPLRPRRVVGNQTLVMARAVLRFWVLTGWPCTTGLDHLWRDWNGCSNSSRFIMGSWVRIVKGGGIRFQGRSIIPISLQSAAAGTWMLCPAPSTHPSTGSG